MTEQLKLPTYTGKMFDPIETSQDMICIEDIAHGLSQLCRYSGQTPRFYSVAEHCYLLAWYCRNILEEKNLAFACLMHDASEAYIVDVPKYIKDLMPHYKYIEEKITQQINIKFHVKASRHERSVKKLDQQMGKSELIDLFRFTNADFMTQCLHLQELSPLPIVIFNFTPVLAERKFLEMYESLTT